MLLLAKNSAVVRAALCIQVGREAVQLGSLYIVVAGEGGISAQQLLSQCAGSSSYLNVLPYNIYVYIQLATSYWMCI